MITLTYVFTRHTSSCMCVGMTRSSGPRPKGPPQAAFKSALPICPRSPRSRTDVRSWGFAASPPSCNSNYLGYWLQNDNFASYSHSQRNYPCFSLSANDSAFCASESWGKITSGCNSCKCFPCIAAILTGLANTVRPFINKVSVTRCCSSSTTATTTRGLKRPPERPTPTRPCWLSLSNARLKREICQPPSASCAH